MDFHEIRRELEMNIDSEDDPEMDRPVRFFHGYHQRSLQTDDPVYRKGKF